MRMRAVGVRWRPLKDLYHFVLTTSWPTFFGFIVLVYLVANLVFATLYLLQEGSIANARAGSFEDHFFFSVQTLSTIGYGSMAPKTLYGHVVVSVEAFLGVLAVALMTGLMFAKFSRPTARVWFSDRAVIAERDGVRSLMIRLGNARANEIINARATVVLAMGDKTPEGESVRRFVELPITRPWTPLFALSWTLIHPIEETSPLYRCGMKELDEREMEVIVVVRGVDSTISQEIHARRSYVMDEISFDMRFADMLSRSPDGLVADYTHFHELIPNEPPGK
jgi:inward rectifier potassium channel